MVLEQASNWKTHVKSIFGVWKDKQTIYVQARNKDKTGLFFHIRNLGLAVSHNLGVHCNTFKEQNKNPSQLHLKCFISI